MMRVRQFLLLVRPVTRAVPLGPMAAAVTLSLVGTLPAFLDAPEPASQVWGLRVAGVLLGAAASFGMVEPMSLLAVTATPRWLRQWARVMAVLLPTAVVWSLLYALTDASSAALLPLGDLVVEALTCALAGIVGGAAAARHGGGATTGLAGAVTQGGLICATLFVPARHSPWALPATPRWEAGRGWWLAVLVVLAVALIAANREVWPVVSGLRRYERHTA
jgi:hypothetical protein